MTESPKEMVGYPVNRGLNEYAEAFGMNKDGMLKWLDSKTRVLDISAGGSLLRKETDILKKQGEFSSDVKIIPLDILYATKEGLDFAKYATHLAFTHTGVRPTKNFISEINNEFTKDAVGASFTDLPFPDNSFEGILASYSFGVHARDKKQMLQAFDEVYRVLTPNGEALVSVIFDMNKDVFGVYDKESGFTYSLDELMLDKVKLKRSGEHFFLQIKK